MKLLPFFILAFFSYASAYAENDSSNTSINWQKWSPQVFQQAQKEKRLVLLDLTAKWCQFCKKMDKITYRAPQVIKIINSYYIPVRADEEDYPYLSKQYENYGRPATIIFAHNQTEIIKRRGYLSPQWMLWLLEAVAQNPSPAAHK